MSYILVYILFFIAQLLYGSWHVWGPLTPRHIMTIVMFVFCIRERAFIIDKYMPWFYTFVTVFLLLGLTGGYESDTLSKFIAYYFVSIVAYYSSLVFLQKYNGGYCLVIVLILLGILNSLITIGNMFMMPWAANITDILHVSNNDELLSNVYSRTNTDSMDGFAVPGLINAVGNGYLMSYLTILSLFSKDKKIHLYNIVIYVLFLTTLALIQERSAFVAGSVLSIYAIFRILKMKNTNGKNNNVRIICIIVFCAITLLPKAYEYMMSGSMRYATEGFNYADGRSSLNEKSMDFILSNPMGGFYDFMQQYHVYPHNLFFNALIYGGLLGGLCIFVLFIKQFILIIPTLTKQITDINYDFFIFSLMFAAYNLCSITHNQSVVTGDPTFWVLWALCLSSWKKMTKSHKYETNYNID